MLYYTIQTRVYLLLYKLYHIEVQYSRGRRKVRLGDKPALPALKFGVEYCITQTVQNSGHCIMLCTAVVLQFTVYHLVQYNIQFRCNLEEAGRRVLLCECVLSGSRASVQFIIQYSVQYSTQYTVHCSVHYNICRCAGSPYTHQVVTSQPLKTKLALEFPNLMFSTRSFHGIMY